jgi:hypothetical protein
MEIKNARIKSTQLGIEDGSFTFWLNFDYGSSVQVFGGYALDEWNQEKEERVGYRFSIDLLRAILKIVDVEKWEDLPGNFIRVEQDHCGINRIGHILKDKWFNPEDFLTAHKNDDIP